MAVGHQLREKQFVVYDELEATAVGGDQGERFDLGLEILQELGCQTDSLRGVVSDRTISN